MNLDMGGEELVETVLKKDDLLVFNPQRKTISIRRGNYWVIFPGDCKETPFPGDETTFAFFANLITYLVTTDASLSEVESDTFFHTVINKEKCITYFV